MSPEDVDARRRLEAVAARLGETGAEYAYHEYLSPEHHPLLVGDFLAEAAEAGLTYIGDAIPSTTAIELLPDEARERALSLDPAAAQQLVDFVRCTAFRRPIVVRPRSREREATWSAPRLLDPGALCSLRVGSRLRAQRPADPSARQEAFAGNELVVQVGDAATRLALHALERAAPQALALDELAHGDRVSLAAELFDLWLATGALDLYDHDMAVAAQPGERPIACPVARWHAVHGGAITSRLHQEVLVPDAIVRWVLARLDGTRTMRDLAREARTLSGSSPATDEELEQLVEAGVRRLALCGVLVPTSSTRVVSAG
jgi:hypothetical protein